MYWVFADSKHLIELIASHVVPMEIWHSEVAFARSPAGEVWVEPVVSIPGPLARALKEHGVRSERKNSPTFQWRTVEAWWQLLPLDRLPNNGEIDRDRPVILEVPSGEEVSRTLQEILRMGGRLQCLHLPGALDEPVHLLVRDLPYFSWLAASDKALSRNQRVFVFRSSQMAIEAGFSHPLVDVIEVSPNHILLLDGQDRVQTISPTRMRTVAENRMLPIPTNEPADFKREQVDPIPARLRLMSRPSSEPPSFWVIPLAELQAWVQGAEQRLVEQLAVAILHSSKSPRVVVRPLKDQTSPVLLWESGFWASRSVPGLYLTWNRDLHPNVRPDVLRMVLECSRDRLTWVSEEPPNPLCVQSVPFSAFCPLVDWIDYELPYAVEPLEPWSPQWLGEFERFQILEEPRERSDKPQRESIDREEAEVPNRRTVRSKRSRSRESTEPKVSRPRVSPPGQRDHREARQRLMELQQSFLASGLPLDAEDHHTVWREMASLHFLLRQEEGGLLCLSHALWNGPPPEPAWFQEVWNAWPGKEQNDSPTRTLETLLRIKKPTAEDLSRLVFLLIWFSVGEFAEPFPRDRIADLQEFLMRFEQEWPIRVGWLAWVFLLKVVGEDALTLARARDRFLERLFAQGIRWERDLPLFLQSGKLGKGNGLAGRSGQLSEFREVLHAWSRANAKSTTNETRTYLDLVLAFGMARRGETAPAKELLESAGNLLRRKRDPLHQWCLEAFEYRIQQVLAGDSPASPWPRHLSEAFQAFSKHDQFKLNRLRQDSQILEPPQTRDLYRAYRQDAQDDLARELADLEAIGDSAELAAWLERLQKNHPNSEARFRVALAGLELAPRLGGTMAERLLEQSAQLLSKDCEAFPRMQLLEKSLRVAAHYDREAWVVRFVEDLSRFLDSLHDTEPDTMFSLESLAGECFQGMRRFGLRGEMIRLLDQMEHLANEPKTSTPDPIKRQLLSLQIAGGRFFFEQNEQAWPMLDRVRKMLHTGKQSALVQTQLARAYLKALAFAPPESAGERFWDFFQNVRGISDAFSLNSHVFVSQLSVVEAFIFAMTGEVNQTDPTTRRLLDDEEYCVRRRIHHDLQDAMRID